METITKEMMAQANAYIDLHFASFKDREVRERRFETSCEKLYVSCETRSEYRTFKFIITDNYLVFLGYEGDWK